MKKISFITNITGAVMILGYILFLAIMWRNIPDTVATHFNAAGVADDYGSKTFLLLEPVLMVVFCVLFAVIEHFPSLWNLPVKITPENRDRQLAIGTVLLSAMKLLILCMFAHAGFSSIFPGFPVWPMYTLLVLTAIVIIGSIVASIKLK